MSDRQLIAAILDVMERDRGYEAATLKAAPVKTRKAVTSNAIRRTIEQINPERCSVKREGCIQQKECRGNGD